MPEKVVEDGNQLHIEDVELPEGLASKVVSIVREALSPRPRGGVIYSDKTNNAVAGDPVVDKEEPEDKAAPVQGLMVWKGDTGRYHWLARYSNSLRDRDRPPEIISAASHKRFVKMVDEGHYPYPELWMWHQKAWKWGEGNYVAFDENKEHPGLGFAMAGGLVDKDKEWIAERYATGEVHSLVSHGMPGSEIVKDQDDPTIYLQHQTVEISPLPPDRAANKHTGFLVFTKENDMALSEEKRQEMADTLGTSADALRQVEQSNAKTGEKAVEEGAEFKEKSEEVPAEPEVKEEAPEVQYVTTKEFETYSGEMVRGFQDVMSAVTEQIKSLHEEVRSLKEVKEVEEKSLTPGASIYAQMLASVGKEAAAPEEIETLTPKQTPDTSANGKNPGIAFVDQMHAMNREALQ